MTVAKIQPFFHLTKQILRKFCLSNQREAGEAAAGSGSRSDGKRVAID